MRSLSHYLQRVKDIPGCTGSLLIPTLIVLITLSYFSSPVFADMALSGGNIPVSIEAGDEEGPLVAFDGTNYLVVWEGKDSQTGITDIYGKFVSKSGVAGSRFTISSSTAYDKVRPSVYFGGTNYLVTWSDYRTGNSDIYGQLISGSGALIGNEIPINTDSGHQYRPVIGFDGTNYLVVWWDNRTGTDFDIHGQFVTPLGGLSGTDFIISGGPGNQQRPEVKFDGANYLVTWEDDRDGNLDIYGRLVTPSGLLHGSEIVISHAANDQDRPRIGFDGINYLVVWRDYRSGIRRDIYGQRLSPSGEFIGAEAAINIQGGNKNPGQLAFDNHEHYLIVWDECLLPSCYQSSIGEIHGQALKKSGIPSDNKLIIATSAGDQYPPGLSFDGINYLAVWGDYRNSIDYAIYGQLISDNDSSDEVCDGVDNDHDGTVDGEFKDVNGQVDCDEVDSDNDGYSDKKEIEEGSDPSDMDSTPESCDGHDDDLDGHADEGYPVGNTPCGNNIEITEAAADDVTTIKFSSVTLSGDTFVSTSNTGPGVPAGFSVGVSPVYHDITTTVAFAGSATVCMDYDETRFETERSLRLLHWNGVRWDDITTSVDTTLNKICGVTTGFSPFIVGQQSSTAITLVNFSAQKDGDHVDISWSTASETDNEGFVILRGDSVSGPFTPISSMMPAMGGPGMKATYTFTDSSVEAGKTYYYRLQDVDSRGIVTAHTIVPVTMSTAGRGGTSEGVTGQGEGRSNKSSGSEKIKTVLGETLQGHDQGPDQQNRWISAVITDTEKRQDLSEADPTRLSGEEGPQPGALYPDVRDINSVPARESNRSHTDSTSMREEYSDISHPLPGPSSLSVSIEDGQGNLLRISKVEDVTGVDVQPNLLQVSEEGGHVVLTWHGMGEVKGFVLHRSEKGKEDYAPVSGMIPYFSRDGKESYLYRFTDNNAKPGVQYDYRLEAVSTKVMNRPENLSMRD